MSNQLPFITLEGPDGAGKSSVLNALKPWLIKNLKTEPYFTREPGGTSIAEQIRNIILNPENTKMVKPAEILLYEAARAQLVESEIKPRLKQNQLIICDRYVDSTVAYQGGGNQIPTDIIHWLNQYATGNLMPSITLYYDINPKIGLQRINQHRQNKQDRLDQKSLEYHQLVRHQYLKLAHENPNRIQIIHGENPLNDNIEKSKSIIQTQFLNLFK